MEHHLHAPLLLRLASARPKVNYWIAAILPFTVLPVTGRPEVPLRFKSDSGS
jgi:hypothetical protein